MKYCVDYKRHFKYLDEVDELTIRYNPEDETLEEFLQLYKNKRINITIQDEKDFIENNRIEVFKNIATENPDLDFVLILQSLKKSAAAKEIYNIIVNCGVPIKYFFFAMVGNWDTLWGYIKYNPSDMYIVESLGFEIDKVAKVLHDKNIKIRTFANVAQSPWKEIDPLRKFFIRPEDIQLYDPYIDVIEFFGRHNSIETLYKIYAKDKQWFGPLNELILDFDSDIDNRFIIPHFGLYRLKCGKRCLKGDKCKICDATYQLSNTLKENKILVKVLES